MLKTRILTAIVLLAILLPILFLLPALYVGIFFLLMILASAWEWSRLIAPAAKLSAWIYVVFCLLIILVLLGIKAPAWQFALLLMATLFWLFLAPFILAKGMKLSLQQYRPFYSFLGLIILPATWFSLLVLRDLGLVFLLTSIAFVWVADIGAYFIGKTFGKRKLASEISPGKSIEGALGGLAFCYLYTLLCVIYLPFGDSLFGALAIRFGWVPLFLLVTLLTLFSIFGDLFESQLKRLAGVKDSSHLLPGHGGVLDRVDALLPTMPMMALLAGLI
jgi:phosphatidate cytidylyltransferase|uniref:phosphatidate cytidylyltransferase n=1 Tax=Polynucleobacter sp. TaxID=2029855 RepID=UPI00404808D7